MCQIDSSFVFGVVTGLAPVIITASVENWRRKKQNKYQDAKDILPIILQILDNLEVLEYAFEHCGVYCPLIEHRCPTTSDKDGDGVSTMSYAQRGYQFRMVAQRIIRDCDRVIFLTPKNNLPKILETCKALRAFFRVRKNDNIKIPIDIMIGDLVVFLREEDMDRGEKLREYAKSIRKYRDALDEYAEQEISFLNR